MRSGQVLKSRRLQAGVLVAATMCLLGTPAARAQEPAAAPRAAQAAPAGDATKGREVFFTYYCNSCHGSDGQGGAGARIAPNTPAFNAFRAYVRKPTGGMPPYISKLLPDTDLADIYAYLKTIQPGQPAKNIPLLNQ